MKTTYDPTPAELPEIEFDTASRSFHSKGRVVLDLRGVSLSRNPAQPPDAVECECIMFWRGMVLADLRLARNTAHIRRRRLFVFGGASQAAVMMDHDGARTTLANLPCVTEAKGFVEALEALYVAYQVPVCIDL